MIPSWNFPKYNFGRERGISDTGIETFKGNRYMHLAKEICQNSLDAALDDTQPVVVEFYQYNLPITLIPEYEKYKQVITYCQEAGEGDKRSEDFYRYALNLLSKEDIPMLRISDFNTTGLTGSKKGRGTAWHNLLMSTGSSHKGATDGGSFGIGKYASFACSSLRTVFYDTYDSDGIVGSLGIAELSYFTDRKGEKYDGIGFYGIGNENVPYRNHFSFDNSFNRNQRTGTDIYVLGFTQEDNWEQAMTYAVVDSFLLAIYQGTLEVKVGNQLIKKESLDYIMTDYLDYAGQDKSRNVLEFYQLLKMPVLSAENPEGRVEFRKDFGNMGEYYYTYCIHESFKSRRVLMSRLTGMKIFELDRFASHIPFTGLCMLEGQELNAYFRKMETPEHDKWSADSFSEDPGERREANRTRLDFLRELRSEVEEKAKMTELDEVDAVGIGSYLPDLTDEFLGQANETEGLNEISTNMQIEARIKSISDYNRSNVQTQILEEDFGDYDNEEMGTFPDGSIKDKETTEKGKPIPSPNEEGEHSIFRSKRITSGNSRVFITKPESNEYSLIYFAEEASDSTSVSISLLGEEGRTKENLDILEAYNQSTNRPYTIEGNKILIGSIDKNESIRIRFRTKEKQPLAMEVLIYGY